MKKPLVLSIVIVLTLLMGNLVASVYSQTPTPDDTPTFYHPTPGTYVNGWPRFTIRYPKDWIERRPAPQDTFRAGTPGPALTDLLIVAVVYNPTPLDKLAAQYVAAFRGWSTEVTLVGDNPSQLRDGTPAREVELKYLRAVTYKNWLSLTIKRGEVTIVTGVQSGTGEIGRDLKAILYSIEFQPDNDKPVTVPPDVQKFLDQWRNDLVAHDLARVMNSYSDRYLDSGVKKREREDLHRQRISGTTSHDVGVTEFVPAGDRAYLAGFSVINGTMRVPLGGAGASVIIKENGEWKWYGNQRDPAP
jgi:hypothetical protein